MSANEKDTTTKKKLKITREVIENLKDEDLEKVTGGEGEIVGGVRPSAPEPGSLEDGT